MTLKDNDVQDAPSEYEVQVQYVKYLQMMHKELDTVSNELLKLAHVTCALNDAQKGIIKTPKLGEIRVKTNLDYRALQESFMRMTKKCRGCICVRLEKIPHAYASIVVEIHQFIRDHFLF